MRRPTENALLLEHAVKVATKAERAVLLPRKKPYWLTIGKGQALGYVKWDVGGLWVARLHGKGDMLLGTTPEDYSRNDFPILTFAEALTEAQVWFLKVHDLFQPPVRISAGFEPWRPGSKAQPKQPTVGDALDELLTVHQSKGIKSIRTSHNLHHRIKAMLGDIPLRDLRSYDLLVWQCDLFGAALGILGWNVGCDIDALLSHPDEVEKRRTLQHTANRMLAFLKAALNRAYDYGWIDSDVAWRRFRPFRVLSSSYGKAQPRSEISDWMLLEAGKTGGSEDVP